MTLLSAKEDFLRHTLANIPGVWARLEYLASLRQSDGAYAHWGLSRVYGEPAVQRVLAEVHRGVFIEVLETPLERLVREAARSAEDLEMPPGDFVRRLTHAPMLVPAQLGGGNVRHFNSVLECLSALGREGKFATDPIS
jgi:hypothetical protein